MTVKEGVQQKGSGEVSESQAKYELTALLYVNHRPQLEYRVQFWALSGKMWTNWKKVSEEQ